MEERLTGQAEQRLIESAQYGDLDSLATLYDMNVNRVFRYSLARLGNRETATDVTRDIFTKMPGELVHYRYREIPFKSWLMRIARKEVRRTIQKNKGQNDAELSLEPSDNIPPEKLQQLLDLRLAVNELPGFLREIVILRRAAGLTTEETAKTLGKRSNYVERRENEAINILELLLRPKYPELFK